MARLGLISGPDENTTRLKLVWQKSESLLQVHPASFLYLPGGFIRLTVWLQFANACFGWEFEPQIASFP